MTLFPVAHLAARGGSNARIEARGGMSFGIPSQSDGCATSPGRLQRTGQYVRRSPPIAPRLDVNETNGKQRDDEDKIGSGPGNSEVTEYYGNRKGKESLPK